MSKRLIVNKFKTNKLISDALGIDMALVEKIEIVLSDDMPRVRITRFISSEESEVMTAALKGYILMEEVTENDGHSPLGRERDPVWERAREAEEGREGTQG
jgi:hypothetical protein